MAEESRREIFITISQDGKSQKPVEDRGESVAGSSSDGVADEVASKASGGLSIAKSIVVHEALSYVKSSVKQVALYEVGKYFSLRDDYVSQRSLQNARTAVSNAIGFGTAIAGAVTFGASVAGPVGGAVSAVVATAGMALSNGVSIWQNIDQQNVGIARGNAQLAFTRERYGYSLTSGSVGEGF